jgi:Flp pilus assembly protein TadD
MTVFGRTARPVLLAVSVLALAACQTKTASLDAADSMATASTSQASFKRTKDLGEKWKADPGNATLGLAYAQSLEQLGQTEQQVEVLKVVAGQNPANAKVQTIYGKQLIKSGRATDAAAALEQAIAAGQADAPTYSALGSSYDQQGHYAKARASYQKALALKPNDPGILNNMGMSHALEGNLKEAEKTLRLAAAQPSSKALPRIRQNLALVVGLQGRFDESRQIASADLPPDQVEANLAYLQSMLSQPNTWQQHAGQPPG